MAGGNRAVIYLRVPLPLRLLADCYQSDRGLQSLNAAIIELLETHPALVERVEFIYAGIRQTPNGEVPPK